MNAQTLLVSCLICLGSIRVQAEAISGGARFIRELQAGHKITLVTMGTSLTAGQWRWPDVMVKEWLDKEFPGLVTFYNEGVSASSTSVGPGNNASLSGLGKLPAAVAHKPDVVFIEFGVNDAYTPYKINLATSKANLNRIIDGILAANPKTEVILMTMHPCRSHGGDGLADRPHIDSYYQIYRDVAKERGLLLVDNEPNWKKILDADRAAFDRLVPDGVHPHLEGYRQVVLPELKATLMPGGAKEVDMDSPDKLFEAMVYTNASGQSLLYRRLVPGKVESGRKYPLVLFLHGAGERGADNAKQLTHVMPQLGSATNRAKYPCYILAPQCPDGQKWADVDWAAKTHSMTAAPSKSMALVLELVDQTLKTLPVDADRVYICGLSMGGYGTWDAISRRPDFFAAAIPVCGGGDLARAPKLTKLPIWAFHGDADPAVPVARTIGMIEAIRASGGTPQMTIYPGVQHNSWTRTFDDGHVIQWLFDQKRR